LLWLQVGGAEASFREREVALAEMQVGALTGTDAGVDIFTKVVPVVRNTVMCNMQLHAGL
jgi:hypothetical protein